METAIEVTDLVVERGKRTRAARHQLRRSRPAASPACSGPAAAARPR